MNSKRDIMGLCILDCQYLEVHIPANLWILKFVQFIQPSQNEVGAMLLGEAFYRAITTLKSHSIFYKISGEVTSCGYNRNL